MASFSRIWRVTISSMILGSLLMIVVINRQSQPSTPHYPLTNPVQVVLQSAANVDGHQSKFIEKDKPEKSHIVENTSFVQKEFKTKQSGQSDIKQQLDSSPKDQVKPIGKTEPKISTNGKERSVNVTSFKSTQLLDEKRKQPSTKEVTLSIKDSAQNHHSETYGESFVKHLKDQLKEYDDEATLLKSLGIEKNLGEAISANQSRNVLIVSTWRSGSTLMGQVLESHPGAWFWSEPVHYLELGKLHIPVDKMTEGKIMPYVQDSFKCKFDEDFVIHNRNMMFSHYANAKFWNICTKKLMLGKTKCTSKAFIDQICPLFPIRIVKTVRMRLETARKLLQNPDLNNLKVIFLVRDPRAVMMSRKLVNFCLKSYCTDPKILCDNHETDLISAKSISNEYPDQFKILRYEDFALNPYNVTDQMLEFLELPPSKHVDNFLEDQTGLKRESSKQVQSATNISRSKAFAWIKAMKMTEITQVQEVCHKPMETFGYIPIKNLEIEDVFIKDFEMHGR